MTREAEQQGDTSKDARKIGFLVIEGFALMSTSAAVEPLRAANLLSGQSLYDVRYFSRAGGYATSSCGASFATQPLRDAGKQVDILFVIAGGDPMRFEDNEVIENLRWLGVRGTALGGISGGAVLLAKAGIMTKRRFTVHWEHYEQLAALSSDYLMERRLFVIDRDRYTCAGGVAPLDMMHALIRSDHGAKLAAAVSDWFIHTGVRSAEEPQRSGYAGYERQLHPSVATAIDLMESHIADPLSLAQVAMLSGIGARQLQRRFDEDIGKGIMRFYMDIRLQKADELIRKTKLSLLEIALTTGFVNQTHFAKVFRQKFGRAPSEHRRAQAD